MVPHKRAASRRNLLPAEAQLCNSLGITEDEYWHFVALNDAYVPDEAELRADPVSIVVSLVVGLAMSAISALLAPKPSQPDEPGPSIKSADKKGQSKFAPQTAFDSVQDLATLGDVVPLIFTRSGVRVQCSLLWSQMLSRGIGQQLRLIGMFGSGPMKGTPDWGGYAVGDVLLENFSKARLALYFKGNGGRITESRDYKYDEGYLERAPTWDAFAVYWSGPYHPAFSGTRTPGSTTEFGAYSPVANGTRLRLKYELVLNPRGISGEAARVNVTKRTKIGSVYPRGISVTDFTDSGATVHISGGDYNKEDYAPIGVEDVRSAVGEGRYAADDNFAIGEEYLVGNKPAVCTSASTTKPWRMGLGKSWYFKWTEGKGWVDRTYPEEASPTHDRLHVQRLAVATVSNNRDCDSTEIGIKSTVYKQINGAANVNSIPKSNKIYDIEQSGGNLTLGSIQSYVKRISFFKLQIRRAGRNSHWIDISGGTVFAIRGRTPQAQYNYIRVYHPKIQWEYRLMPYPGTAVLRTKRNRYCNLLTPGATRRYNEGVFTIEFAGQSLKLTDLEMCNTEWITEGMRNNDPRQYNLNAYDVVNDGFTYQEETASHANSPEHSITYVNEYIKEDRGPQYEGLALVGLKMDSTREWTSFSSLSAYFKDGIIVERLNKAGKDSTNLLPEIAYALLTDEKLGAGKLIGADQVDKARMIEAAKFCYANGFTWDGVIDQKLNLRQWIFEQAGYCLLDFTILGGRFSLVPSLPVKSNWKIDYNGKPEIKALFTDGNIKDLKVSFLSPGERQLFTGVATWRLNRENAFPETRTLSVRLSDAEGGSDNDPVETFEMAGFCTSEEHVEKFLKFALKMRQLVDHGLTFSTTPQSAMGLEPGQYVRLVSEATHTSRFNNGTIGDDGTIQCVDVIADGEHSILYWEPGTEGVKEARLLVKDGKAQDTSLRGTLFTIKNSTTTDRTYKVESINYGEDGFVDVAASFVPLTAYGSLAVLDWNEGDFVSDSF